jgi:hypothetical protein
MLKKPESKRLPRNFHRTFKPERQYVNAMLRYAASGREGSMLDISKATGIPTGASTGKVPAILDYCLGMGLISVNENSSAIKKPELTNFGRVLLLEDPYLKIELSQWIAHFNMCNRFSGADVWYHVFWEDSLSLGMSFTRESLDSILRVIYKTNKGNMIGPMVGTYEDEAAFKLCNVLSESENLISRKSAPISDDLGRGYGAWILQMIEDYFPRNQQISITELDEKCGWRTIPGWSIASSLSVLELIERKGLIKVDRQMKPWLLQPLISASDAWRKVYIDMI